MSTICGHDRGTIKSLCALSELALRMNAYVDPLHEPSPVQSAANALLDPAKLGEIIVQTVQEFGVACELWRNVRDFYDAPSDNVLDVIVGDPILYFYAGSMKRMTMSQVHVFALRLLQWEGEFDLAKVLEGL